MKTLPFWILLIISTFLTGCTQPPSQQQLLEKYTNPQSKFVTIESMKVHYRDEGEGDVILLLHGTASSLHTWDAWSNILSRHYRVIRMDLPGFGLTGPDPFNRYEVSDDVVFIEAFLQTLNIEKTHLIGSSLGGRIAWEYALKHPNKTNTLTLINALGYKQTSWPPAIQLAMLPGMDSIVPKLSSRFVFNQSLKDIYFNENLISDQMIDRYYELSLYPGNAQAFPKRVKASLDKHSSKIREITVPTLILWGEEDKYFPVENAYKFHQDIAKSTLTIYKETAHLPMEEKPEQSAHDTLTFIASTY